MTDGANTHIKNVLKREMILALSEIEKNPSRLKFMITKFIHSASASLPGFIHTRPKLSISRIIYDLCFIINQTIKRKLTVLSCNYTKLFHKLKQY